MNSFTWRVAVVLAVIHCLGNPLTLYAYSILDQSFDPSGSAAYQGNIIKSYDGHYVDQAQTFTVGITGILTNVEVLIWGFSQTDNIYLDIRPTLNGIPISDDSSILGEVIIPASEIPTFPPNYINIDVSTENIHVDSGSLLAIVLSVDSLSLGADYAWRGETGDLYPSGIAYTRTSTTDFFAPMSGGLTVDFGFATYIEPGKPIPEPTTMLLCSFGLAFLAGFKTYNRKR